MLAEKNGKIKPEKQVLSSVRGFHFTISKQLS